MLILLVVCYLLILKLLLLYLDNVAEVARCMGGSPSSRPRWILIVSNSCMALCRASMAARYSGVCNFSFVGFLYLYITHTTTCSNYVY